MSRADLHVHSLYSEKPGEWFLQRLGAAESYTTVDHIYNRSLEAGMDFITITDHNRMEGSLILQEKDPVRCFTGVESTTYFPEDGCKLHVLIYGLNEEQFARIQKIRTSVYDLREYLLQEGLTHSVAHPAYSMNGKLELHHIEKLLLLFNVFETMNGSRSRRMNQVFDRVAMSLSPEKIDDLRKKHSIEPHGDHPWIKGRTGGSDDHAGLFIGRNFTIVEGATGQADFLERLKKGQTGVSGDYNNYKYMAFTLYKIAYDFSRNRSGKNGSRNLLSQITEIFFRQGPRSFTDNITLAGIRLFGGMAPGPNRVKQHFFDLIQTLSENQNMNMEDRMNLAYGRIGDIADEFARMLFESVERDLHKGDIMSVIRNISSSLPGIFLSVPFFTTLAKQNQGRRILDKMELDFGIRKKESGKRILWFSDTLNDLNGVSVTLKKIGWASHERGRDLSLVTALTPEEWSRSELPPETLNLPFVYNFKLPYYERYIMKVPAILKALEMIHDFDPDEIYISTPGPIGMLGLLASRLLNVRSVGIYHTDFTLQAREIVGDEALLEFIETSTRWFYGMMDENRVPTTMYMNLLEERGFDRSKMTLFRRGIDSRRFYPKPETSENIRKRFNIPAGTSFVFVGRISQDKNLELLMDAYDTLVQDYPECNLVFAGEGPFMDELLARKGENRRIIFTGKLTQEELPDLYSTCDALVFPSFTDTFGMAVLEAQTCGLPAIVSDRGGPQEIIDPDETGYICRWDSREEWHQAMARIVQMKTGEPDAFQSMRKASRDLALRRNDWKVVIDEYLGPADDSEKGPVQEEEKRVGASVA